MCFQLQPFSRLMSSSFSVRSDRFMGRLPCFKSRHVRPKARSASSRKMCRASTSFSVCPYEDVDGRGKPGPDVCFDSSCRAVGTDAVTHSGFTLPPPRTLRGSLPGLPGVEGLLRLDEQPPAWVARATE